MKKHTREVELEEKKIELRENQKKEDIDARNVREIAKCYVFSMICGSGGSKSMLGKAAGADVAV